MNLLTAYLTKPATQRILRKKPGQEGFSLIELVVVIAVLAILAVIALPNFQGVTQSASAQSMKTALADIYKQCYVMRSRGTPANNRVILAPVIADVTFSPLVGANAALVNGVTHVNCSGVVLVPGEPAVIGASPTAGGVLAGVVPTFQLEVASGNKVCSVVADFGCSAVNDGTW
jgi:type IV pilus assembly protein PilA